MRNVSLRILESVHTSGREDVKAMRHIQQVSRGTRNSHTCPTTPARRHTERPAQPLEASTRVSSSHGRLEGASGWYTGRNWNLWWHSCKGFQKDLEDRKERVWQGVSAILAASLAGQHGKDVWGRALQV